jgi:aspartate/methionine/tyrosine aminotransferase
MYVSGQLLTLFPQLALQKHFKAKRDHILARLKALHLEVDIPPTSTFYIWLNLEKLPAPLNNGLVCPPFTKRLHHLSNNTLDLIDVL